MHDHDFDDFMAAWNHAWLVCGKECAPAAMDASFEALSGYALQDILDALHRHTLDPERGQFPPKPADIVRQIDGTDEQAAMGAWGKLRYAIRHVGGYRSVAFDDPAIHAVVKQMGGWGAVNNWTESEIPYRQRDFAKAYSACRRTAEAQGVLKGLYHQYQPDDITYIGDEEKARISASERPKELSAGVAQLTKSFRSGDDHGA